MWKRGKGEGGVVSEESVGRGGWSIGAEGGETGEKSRVKKGKRGRRLMEYLGQKNNVSRFGLSENGTTGRSKKKRDAS